MVGDNLKDVQLQQIVDKTIIYADKDGDGMVSFDEFCNVRRFSPSLLDSHRLHWVASEVGVALLCEVHLPRVGLAVPLALTLRATMNKRCALHFANS